MDIDPIQGSIIGTAVGDALGLPCEGMSGRRVKRMFPELSGHHFMFGRGMVSDDTEHTCFVAQAIITSGGEPHLFGKHLARSLRWWLICLPAGVGFATLRAVLKLWAGFSPEKSGVFSAGNGPAMRSPLLGVVYGSNPDKLKKLVECSTRVTHTDPKAFCGSYIIALAAHLSAEGRNVSPRSFAQTVKEALKEVPEEEIIDLVRKSADSAEQGENTVIFAESIGCKDGISGYIYHTVPCVIQTWLRHQNDYKKGIREIVLAGGDADTTAAILGGIIGARVGVKGIPGKWVGGITEWPRSIRWMTQLGKAVHSSMIFNNTNVPGYFKPALIPRNIIFLVTVLVHGFRRLLPPY